MGGRAAVDPLSRFTGIELPQGPPSGRQLRVASRAEWIDFNIDGFGALMEPVLKRAAAGSDNLTWAIGGATLTAQVGLLLGFLSARVLGQYDTGPLLARERAGEPGKVFFLDGNIAAAAGRIAVPVDGLRLWIVLHEMTHALQFEGYPWLRAHLGELLERLIFPARRPPRRQGDYQAPLREHEDRRPLGRADDELVRSARASTRCRRPCR